MAASTEPGKTKLEEYKYKALESPNALRLLRLRPASDENHDIDAELAEFGLPEHNQGAGDASPDGQAKKEKDGTKVEEKPSYEAVSWCWGREKQDQLLRLHKNDKVYAFYISKNLKTALWALRKNDEVRQLWIDAICIDQKNTKERNEQVPKMDRIYGSAKSVAIWLGDADEDSKLAMDFIKNQVLSIWGFDMLIENREMAQQWAAFIKLMKRPWFSRRWVVQEIALSPSGGNLYCGKDEVSWSDFADAVSLFVEVESATHRLSDVMKRNEFFGHISDFFGDVSSLGAALLVDATSNLFRSSQTGERKPLSTLEYLVSRLSVFEASQPRDTIYALLAISKDTTPRNIEQDISAPGSLQAKKKVMAWAQHQAFTSQPYIVDYKLPVIDVYKQFIEFSIRKSDKTRALDMICRPWAPTVLKRHDKPAFLLDPSGVTTEQEDNKDEKNEKEADGKKGGEGEKDKKHKKYEKDEKDEKNDDDEEVPLPSWIPSLSSAAFEMEEHPTAGLRMERQNADPLVGLPGSGQTNYSAAGTKTLDVKKFRFLKWTTLQKEDAHYPDYSMFVQGFVLDEVSTVEQIASNGNMPYQWLKPGGWTDTDQKPPDAFWRTLVADRGHNGRNPPTYFPRACKESMKFKAKIKSKRGNLDSKKLINEGQCTIVAEFLRRVQAVIWNRLLMKTKDGRLGLVRDDVKPGYMVCILYGCSVPVVLQKMEKKYDDMLEEQKIFYEEWLQKRKRVVSFFTDMWRMVLHRRTQGPPQKIKTPESSKEALELLQRPRKSGTFPLKTNEDPERDSSPFVHFTSPGYGTIFANDMSSDKGTMHDNRTSDSTEALPDESTASVYASALIDQTTPRHGIEHSASSKEGIGHGNDKIEAPQSQVEATGENLNPENKKQEAEIPEEELPEEEDPELETPEAYQLKGKQKEKEDPEVALLRKKKWQQLSLPRRKALGERQAKRREDYEFKFAMPSRWYYRLFGECYVHGVMNGEAIALQNTMFDKGQMLQQMFELR
jgi:Heterokaryon incompatibility protein (HET)